MHGINYAPRNLKTAYNLELMETITLTQFDAMMYFGSFGVSAVIEKEERENASKGRG